jgi:hypothetical protein
MSGVVINHSGGPVEVEIIRERRGTIQLKIKPPGRIIARIPKKTTVAELKAFIDEHNIEIQGYLDRILIYSAMTPQYSFAEGDTFSVMGKNFRLVLEPSQPGDALTAVIDTLTQTIQIRPKQIKHRPALKNGQMGQQVSWLSDTNTWQPSKAEISHAIEQAMIKFAEQHLGTLVERYALQMGAKPSKVHIGKAKTRYGSCNSQGRLMFCWRIIMAPEDIIEYLVVHELAHLFHLNHSKAFYEVVESVMPTYKTANQWLKKNGARLVWPDSERQ